MHLFSNGSVFDSAARQRFIATCPRARVTFSLDATTPATFAQIRRLKCFGEILKNIRAFSGEKRNSHDLMISNNINLLNIDEAVEMVDLAKDLGASIVHFNPTHDCGSGRKDLDAILVSRDNYQHFEQVQSQIFVRSQEISIPVKFHRPLALNYKTLPVLPV